MLRAPLPGKNNHRPFASKFQSVRVVKVVKARWLVVFKLSMRNNQGHFTRPKEAERNGFMVSSIVFKYVPSANGMN